VFDAAVDQNDIKNSCRQ